MELGRLSDYDPLEISTIMEELVFLGESIIDGIIDNTPYHLNKKLQKIVINLSKLGYNLNFIDWDVGNFIDSKTIIEELVINLVKTNPNTNFELRIEDIKKNFSLEINNI